VGRGGGGGGGGGGKVKHCGINIGFVASVEGKGSQ